jgi:hypothetical protein
MLQGGLGNRFESLYPPCLSHVVSLIYLKHTDKKPGREMEQMWVQLGMKEPHCLNPILYTVYCLIVASGLSTGWITRSRIEGEQGAQQLQSESLERHEKECEYLHYSKWCNQ